MATTRTYPEADAERGAEAERVLTDDLFGASTDVLPATTSRDHYRQALAAAHAMRGQRGKRRKVRQGQQVCTHLIGMLQAAREEQARH